MKRIIFVLLVLLVAVMPWAGSVVLAGLDYSIEWTRQFGTSALDYAHCVAVDSSGNVFVAGYTKGAFPGYTNLGSDDAFVRKYNSAGVEQWTRQFGTSSSDAAWGVAADSSGNAYVVGGTVGAFPGYTNLGSDDAFVRKYNSAGVEQWTRQFGSNDRDIASGVAVNSSDNVLVAGYAFGTLPGQSSAGGEDAFVRKYNSAGIEQWTRQFGTSASDGAWGVAVDSSGNAYVVGGTYGAFPGYTNLGGDDAFLRKYNSAGVEQWTRQFGTPTADEAYGVAVDSSGNVFVAGYTRGAFPGYTNLGGYDAFVRQYNSAGVEQRTRQFGTPDDDIAFGVAVDSSGNVYVAGVTSGILPGQSSAGSMDAFVMKFMFTPQSRILYPAEYRWSTVFRPKTQLAPSPATFMSWQQVRFENKGITDAYNVTATITWVPANTTIADGRVILGNIAAGSSAWSTDDFALVVDMTNPQPPGQGILWRVEYNDVLGVYHVLENVPQLTKGMVDTQQTGGKKK